MFIGGLVAYQDRDREIIGNLFKNIISGTRGVSAFSSQAFWLIEHQASQLPDSFHESLLTEVWPECAPGMARSSIDMEVDRL